MLRTQSNEELLLGLADGNAEDEPQLIFHRDSVEIFDEAFPYGARPKVELMWRLGVPGPWHGWETDPWDLPAPRPCADAGRFGYAGWVGRLGSGHPEMERGDTSTLLRSLARSGGILGALGELDRRALAAHHDADALSLYDDRRIARLVDEPSGKLSQELARDADAALSRGPYSVADKTGLPHGAHPNDYRSAARYYWPNPATLDGLPYVHRDGQIVFDSGLAGFAADQFDHERARALFDDTTVLALAGTVHREPRYLEHAARLVRCWFVDPATRMTPHLRFAQVALGHDGDENPGRGVLDFSGLSYFLDAVRLIERAGALDPASGAAFRHWLRSYSDWLRESPAGRHARREPNNHGTFYDLQSAAIASFLGDMDTLGAGLRRARLRMALQFAGDGSQTLELRRTRPFHYCHYNLAAWAGLARLAEAVDDDLWNYRTPDGRGLETAMRWLLAQPRPSKWRESKVHEFDPSRLLVLRDVVETRYGERAEGAKPIAESISRPDWLSGVPPYWMLQR